MDIVVYFSERDDRIVFVTFALIMNSWALRDGGSAGSRWGLAQTSV